MAIALSALNTGVIITLLFLSSAISIVLGGIAWSRIVSLFLPFPASWGAISTLYPILPFLFAFVSDILASRYQQSVDTRKYQIALSSSSSAETVTDGNNDNNDTTVMVANRNIINRPSSRPSLPRPSLPTSLYPFIASTLDHLLTILPTVIATLAATYVAPSDNRCHLEQTWQSFYHNKDVRAIRTIQDQLQCCGLRSTRDRAWPFKDSTHGDNSCESTTGYRQSCLQPWSEQERRVAVLVLVAAVFGWGIKMGISSLNLRFIFRGNRGNAWTNFNHENITRDESTGPRYRDDENADSGHGGASDDDPTISRSLLINPGSRDFPSLEDTDLTGTGRGR
ncbi:hypothetical protein UA08_00378 [Talaromyces atroroseus]|uniref:Tetraspanin Tsp3 n=1 Tax=Talaromyces atroroseus TaxID=1441469 RepID=A0A225BAW5_TALAT|nr:hypothetical protein UA08_00378 [Talaromyces atroroseus]OKL64055.1 hypothetical protein UA08_00378 [Talaromyces atroroseus]